VSAESFWGLDIYRRMALVNIKIFNPLASSSSLAQCFHHVGPVFSCCGGMGPAATVVYKQFTTLISEK